MARFKLKFAPKFYLGIALTVASLIIGGITKLTFLVYFTIDFIRWLSLIFYFLSWPMLVLGVWWVGKEYYIAIRKYFTYRFYHESVKRKAKGAYHKTRHISGKVKKKLVKKKKQPKPEH